MRRRDRIAKLEAEISFLHLRTGELERIFTDRYGPQLPNNARPRLSPDHGQPFRHFGYDRAPPDRDETTGRSFERKKDRRDLIFHEPCGFAGAIIRHETSRISFRRHGMF